MNWVRRAKDPVRLQLSPLEEFFTNPRGWWERVIQGGHVYSLHCGSDCLEVRSEVTAPKNLLVDISGEGSRQAEAGVYRLGCPIGL